MPKPDLTTRIIATDLPGKTYTGTSFDDPKRKDVVQTDLPTQVTRTYEETIDPAGKKKKAVQTVSGTIYHGTGSTDPNVVFGTRPAFIEKNSKEFNNNHLSRKKNTKRSKKSKRSSSEEDEKKNKRRKHHKHHRK